MKRVRLTYERAYHHGMNRGTNGEDIFCGHKHKAQFLDFLEESLQKYKLRLFAYCIMDNHYHLVLENSSLKLSDFFRHLNGQYGSYYRKTTGGKGYVFQNRFKSTLIQDESYLKMSIAYVLLNPVKAGIISDYTEYIWSSGSLYFSGEKSDLVDSDFVTELFESKANLIDVMSTILSRELPVIDTKYGELLGETDYMEKAVKRFERRNQDYGEGMKRIKDGFFEPVEKIIREFEHRIGYEVEDLPINTLNGKRLRGELLVRLRDYGGLRYSEISKIPPFECYRQSSMAKLYRDTKLRLKKKKLKPTK